MVQSLAGDSLPSVSHGGGVARILDSASLWGLGCSWTLGGGRHAYPETAFGEVLAASPSWSPWAGMSWPTKGVSIPHPVQPGA